MKRSVSVLLALVALSVGLLASAQSGDANKPASWIGADKIVKDAQGTVTMTGHVTITANGVVIHADAAVSDPITHDVQLTGNVHATFLAGVPGSSK
jgi:lipopolysaccharide export system protein LptA